MAASHSIRVLIVTDQERARQGMTDRLHHCPHVEVVAEASTGEAAVAMSRLYFPDVAILDVQSPSANGLGVARQLLHAAPHLKIFALSLREEGFSPTGPVRFRRDFHLEELLSKVRPRQKGVQQIGHHITQLLSLKQHDKCDGSPFDRLSKRELEIVLLILRGRKAPEVADALNLSPKTVNTYRYRIYDKLGIDGDASLVRLGLQYGVITEAPILDG